MVPVLRQRMPLKGAQEELAKGEVAEVGLVQGAEVGLDQPPSGQAVLVEITPVMGAQAALEGLGVLVSRLPSMALRGFIVKAEEGAPIRGIARKLKEQLLDVVALGKEQVEQLETLRLHPHSPVAAVVVVVVLEPVRAVRERGVVSLSTS